MNEELKKELEEIKSGLETKSKELAQAELKAFGEKLEAELAKAQEEAKEARSKEAEELKKALEEQIAEIKEHAKKLDAKVNAPAIITGKTQDPLREMIKDNFEDISRVQKGNAVKLETKVVADMSLGNNLTGDQPRAYSDIVQAVPSQLVNVGDLVGSINISGGTYTFPRETGSEGAIATQVEGSDKSQIDYDITMVDVNTDFIAGFSVYSKKMRNNLPFLESFLPNALRRDYAKQENSTFAAVLEAGVTASAQLAANNDTFIEQLMKEVATLEGSDFGANGMVVSPGAWYTIFTQEKSAGSGYARPGIVSLDGGVLRINGIPVFKANWLSTTDKYLVGDWSYINKVVTEGLSLEFSENDASNFRQNKITARIEAQVALAIGRTDAMIFGDFTAI